MRTRTVLSIVIAACAAFLTAASPAPAKVIYVDSDATGANNGSSWANAYTNLQNALEDASGSGEIRVAQGVYRPSQSNRDEKFDISGDLAIKGGYAGWGEPDPDARDVHRYPTVLSGDLAGNDIEVAAARDLLTEPSRTENSSRILVTDGYGEGETPVLEGFTITGAKGDVWGGGLYINYGDAIVTDCIFVNNSTEDHGGAMAFNNGRVIFTRCRFIRNAAQRSGGAVYLNGCGTCRSMYGAFIDCIFIDNYCSEYGGAIHNTSVSMATCINCLFVGNTAVISGAALYDNAYNLGSYLVNCTLAGNNCTAVHIAEYGSATLSNCILWDNLCGTGTGQSAQILYQEGPWRKDYKPSVNYCCIQDWDGSFGGVGNFSANPLFVSPGSWDLDLNYTPGDYHLKPDSPCINAGDTAFTAKPTSAEIPPGYYWIQEVNPDDYVAKSSDRDLDGGRRLAGGKVDMGSYEYYEHEPPALVAHWKLDEAEGDTAKDSAGTNDGALHGGPQWQPYSGHLQGALLFDGENDYVNCGSDSAFDITGQITVAAWANFNSVNMEWQTVIAKGDSAWRLSTASNYRRYHFAVTGGPPWNYINGDIEVAANEWHHVCGTYDGANLRLYIDGVEDPAGPVPELNGVTTDDYDVYIGENQERPGRYWDGLIDDVRVYNYALSPAQVFNLCKPGVLYVDADAPGANNGSSWANAFKCLQDALAAAADGTEIRVAQGTYRPDRGAGITPGDRQAAFGLQNGVTIKGGYAGHGEPEPDARSITQYPTILSGDLLGNDGPEQANRIDNSRHVVTASTTNTTAVLDGVAITAGYADGIDSDYPFINNGAGMYNKNGSPTLIDCTFTQNIVVLYDHEYGGLGAAIYNLHSNPVIRNCTFRQNSASGGHGAVCNETSSPMISDCTFEDNDGGGIEFRYETSGTVTGCSFIGNTTAYGAGVNCEYGSSPSISDCTFVGNIAWYDGGALRCYVNCTPVVTNCIFAGNKTTIQNGGAICALESSPVFANCTFIGNSANRNGGAIHCYRTSHPKVANSILWGNSAPDGSQISLTYYQHPGEDPSATEITLSYCDIQGGFEGIFLEEMCCANWGPGNIVVDPCFVSPGYWDSNATPGDAGDDSWVNGDYHLKSFGWRWDAAYEEWTFDRVTSRCIDAGNPGSPLAEEPLTIPDDPDNEYGQNVRINMGAYGGTAQASMPPYDWALLADINNDGIADFCDFAYAGLCWALTAPEQPCDLNRSGDVNPADLDLFADDWLKTTIWRK